MKAELIDEGGKLFKHIDIPPSPSPTVILYAERIFVRTDEDAVIEYVENFSVWRAPLPAPVWSGSFKIGKREIKCHVLDDGQRVVEAESIEAIFDSGEELTDDVVRQLALFIKGNGVPA